LPFFLDTDGFIAPVAVSPPWPFPPYSPLRVGVASSRGDGGVCGAAISISANFFQSWGEGDGGGDKREGARRGAAPRGLAAGEGNGRRGGDVVGPPGTLPARCHVGAATPGARLSSGDPSADGWMRLAGTFNYGLAFTLRGPHHNIEKILWKFIYILLVAFVYVQ
jgi:hypothetical protein